MEKIPLIPFTKGGMNGATGLDFLFCFGDPAGSPWAGKPPLLSLPQGLSHQRRGVEQWQLVGLITRRSLVRIQPPLPKPQLKKAPEEIQGLFAVLALFICGDSTTTPNASPLNPLKLPAPVWTDSPSDG